MIWETVFTDGIDDISSGFIVDPLTLMRIKVGGFPKNPLLFLHLHGIILIQLIILFDLVLSYCLR